jgi:hypothetical protein
MLEFPDAKRGQQQTLCARQRSDRGQFSFDRLRAIAFPRTAAFRFGSSGSARGFTKWEVASIVHGR